MKYCIGVFACVVHAFAYGVHVCACVVPTCFLAIVLGRRQRDWGSMREAIIPSQPPQNVDGLEPRWIHRVQKMHADYVQGILCSAELSM